MADETEKTSSIPVRILLVDNDKDHAHAMHESLERIGLDVRMRPLDQRAQSYWTKIPTKSLSPI